MKNAQEAHEAIRPAGHPFALPEELRSGLSSDEFRLYDLIWKRTVASQMADARGRRITITVEGGGAIFSVGGKTIDFPGYLRAYVEGSDDPQADLAERDTVLPQVEVGERLTCAELDPKSHTTQPPARYSEASLTRALEEMGIGRPSTYASIIETIQAREYVFKKGNALVPTWVAFSVSQLLSEHLPYLVDYQFTAQMEDDLDAISRGESGHTDYLRGFYFGNGKPGLEETAGGQGRGDRRPRHRPHLHRHARKTASRSSCAWAVMVRSWSRANAGRACATKRRPTKSAWQWRWNYSAQAAQADEPLGHCPETGKPVFLKVGRFGPYVQRGTPEDEEKPKNASLLKGMQPEDVTLEVALKLLSLPRELGPHPENGNTVVA